MSHPDSAPRQWATEFAQHVSNRYGVQVEQEWVACWFAQALIYGYDKGKEWVRRHPEKVGCFADESRNDHSL